jgi:hypothetical protein
MGEQTQEIRWLLEEGGPAIRYRTATELIDDPSGIDLDRLTTDLLQSSMVRQWLDRIGLPGGLNSLHGSQPEAFENVCAKLCELGLRAGMLDEFDQKALSFRQHLAQGEDFWGRPLLASCLNWAGYGDDEAVRACLSERLEAMYKLAHSGDYDIYIDQDTFGDFPAAFRKKPLVSPDFYDRLPSIWDIYALAHWPEALTNGETQRQIAEIVAYILHPDYQALQEGYGVMRAEVRRYYSMGWSVHLPGYGSPHTSGVEFDRSIHEYIYVQRLELMAHFAIARQSQWFQDSIQHLEGFRTAQGTYRFPGRYLREGTSGYWVTGAYMRLEENRRVRRSLELDSTFRMALIGKLTQGQRERGMEL